MGARLSVIGLAVLTPRIGAPSETFIERHLKTIAPGTTAAVVRGPTNGPVVWSFDGPVFDISQERSLPRRVMARSRLGVERLQAGWALRREPVTGVPGPLATPPRSTVREIAAFLQDHDAAAVLAEYLELWTWAVTPLRRAGLRFVAHAHGADVSIYPRHRYWRRRFESYRQADAVVAVSLYMARKLRSLGIEERRVAVVPCGVDVPTSPPPRGERATLRALAVGRLVPKKDPLATVHAIALARERVEIELDLVGDGPLRGLVTQFVAQNGLERAVRVHGALPHEEVRALYRDADLFVQHSRVDPITGDEEGMPVSILEAMAEGLPVVSTWHAGIPEAVIDGLSGRLVAEGDVGAMAAAVVELATSRSRRVELGGNGWDRARRLFDSAREANDLRSICRLEPTSPLASPPADDHG